MKGIGVGPGGYLDRWYFHSEWAVATNEKKEKVRRTVDHVMFVRWSVCRIVSHYIRSQTSHKDISSSLSS